ncbi:MAG: hypothetical protein HUK01_08755 [Bacteroidaceae bacterium]|nr:hypothetical protein [Bacteroidaceae bacterium]
MGKMKFLLPIVVACIAVGCSNTDSDNGAAYVGHGVTFSASQGAGTRAQYSADDWLQLVWETGDELKIWCDRTQYPSGGDPSSTDPAKWSARNQATYVVTKLTNTSAPTSSANSIAEIGPKNSSTDKLYWSSGPHTFYAGYGGGLSFKTASQGLLKCEYATTQNLVQKSGKWINSESVYLASKFQTMPSNDVTLPFKPIMTTLELEIAGMSSAATYNEPVYITQVRVTVPQSQDKTYTEGGKTYFDYEIPNWSAPDAATQTEKTYTFKFPTTVTDAQQAPVGGALTATIVLPPIDLETSDELKVEVWSLGWGSYSVTLKNADIKSGEKHRLKTNAWKYDKTDENYVDLGLSVKWAKYNVGASLPTEIGGYFQWGATSPMTGNATTGWATYNQSLSWLYSNGYITSTATKYESDGKRYAQGILTSAKDAATQIMGSPWRMPTIQEFSELVNGTTQSVVTMNGVTGVLFTSNANGNCIFMTLGGRWDTNGKQKVGQAGHYWSVHPAFYNGGAGGDLQDSWCFEVTNTGACKCDLLYVASGNYTFDRHMGRSVRGVRP